MANPSNLLTFLITEFPKNLFGLRLSTNSRKRNEIVLLYLIGGACRSRWFVGAVNSATGMRNGFEATFESGEGSDLHLNRRTSLFSFHFTTSCSAMLPRLCHGNLIAASSLSESPQKGLETSANREWQWNERTSHDWFRVIFTAFN